MVDFFKGADFMEDAAIADIMRRQGIAKVKVGTPTPPPVRPLSAGNNMANLSLDEIEARLKRKIDQAYGGINAAFRASDADSSRTIGYNELKRILDRFCFKIDDKKFKQLARRFDSNNDGVIQYQEFLDYFTQKPSRPSTARSVRDVPQQSNSAKHRSGNSMMVAARERNRQKHQAALKGRANDELKVRLRQKISREAGTVLRACAVVDKHRTGYIHRKQLKVVLETYLFSMAAAQFDLLVKPFEGGGDSINYKALVARYKTGASNKG